MVHNIQIVLCELEIRIEKLQQYITEEMAKNNGNNKEISLWKARQRELISMREFIIYRDI